MRVAMALREPARLLLDAVAPRRCAGCDRSGAVLCEGCVAAVEELPLPLIAGAGAAFPYQDAVRAIVHRGKFRDCRSALRALAWLGASRLQPPPGAVVAPVPLSPARRRERGYNQAEVVAGAFARFHRLPERELLERTRDTPPQSMLGRPGRRANVEGAFRAGAMAGGTVWLVDDVRTTGATTEAARRALLEAGAGRVEVAVLAAVV